MFNAQDIILARQFKPDLSISKLDAESLIMLMIMNYARGGGVVPIYDADIINGIATFDGVTRSKPLVSLLLNLPVMQEGSGTPSPDNVREFITFSGVNIGQTSGYGEYFRGLLNGTYGFVDLGSLNWRYGSGSQVFYTEDITDMSEEIPFDNMVCPAFETLNSNISLVNMTNYSIKRGKSESSMGTIYVKDTDYTDADAFKNEVSGVYLIYELAEPSTPVTPEQFATLCQAFGITGNTYSISFGQTVYSAILDVLTGKLYLTHEIKAIDENSLIDMTSITSVFYWNDFFDIANDTESVNCNCYYKDTNKANPNSVSGLNHNLTFCCRTSAPTLYIKDTRFTTIEDYKTWLSTHPVKIAVKLAEPIEIDLTPTVINTLIGENVIFADVANVTECKYTRK